MRKRPPPCGFGLRTFSNFAPPRCIGGEVGLRWRTSAMRPLPASVAAGIGG